VDTNLIKQWHITILQFEQCKVINDTLQLTIKNRDIEISFDTLQVHILKIDTAKLDENVKFERQAKELAIKDIQKRSRQVKLYKTTTGLVGIIALIALIW
jgi:hypothetical protein